MRSSLLITILAVLVITVVTTSDDCPCLMNPGACSGRGQIITGGIALLEPIRRDPTLVYFHVHGNEDYGEFNITQRDPSDLCIPEHGATQCGRQVQDTTMMVNVRDGILSLNYLSNNPTVSLYSKTSVSATYGSYVDGIVRLYTHTSTEIIQTFGSVRSYIITAYFGKVVNGEFYGMVLDSTTHYLVSQGNIHSRPYRSPAAVGRTENTPTPYFVMVRYMVEESYYDDDLVLQVKMSQGNITGHYRDTKFEDGMLYGKITAYSSDTDVKRLEGWFISDYDGNHQHINLGLMVYHDGSRGPSARSPIRNVLIRDVNLSPCPTCGLV